MASHEGFEDEMQDQLHQLRRQAHRLRNKAGMPTEMAMLSSLSETALRILIRDAHRTMTIKREIEIEQHELLHEFD